MNKLNINCQQDICLKQCPKQKERIQNQNNMKSTKQVINDVIKKLVLKQKISDSLSPSTDESQLNAFDLIPIEFTGMIEDYLFRESGEIFNILKEETDQDIEGLTYDQIKNDSIKNNYYDKVRLNIPKYYSLKPSDRQKHFKQQDQLYIQKLGLKPQQLQKVQQAQYQQKKYPKSRELTPMKQKRISKRQTKNVKKQQKKNIQKNKQNSLVCHQDQFQILSSQRQILMTPKKKDREMKKVSFHEFEYVKDFSQYKTPKNLSGVKQWIQPLKQVQKQKNNND